MALFGGQRRNTDWGRIGTFLLSGTNGLDRRDQGRQRILEEEQLRQQTALSDRLRAQLSPADGPNGSGTGAAPSVEQQMAALNEARLLNPAVADQFAPFVQGNRMREMTQGLPLAQQLAIELNPERAGQSFATQFEDMPLAAGTVRSRGDQSIAAAPRVDQFGDRFGIYDPITGETRYSQPRSPTFAENTDRITAERPQIASLSPGQQAYGVDPYSGVTPLAQNTSAPPVSPEEAQRQTRALDAQRQQIGSVRNALGRARDQIGFWTTGPLAGLSSIGGTPAADLAATLDTIEANLSFQALADMRANSPTGGALGSITERELQLLGSTVASLKQSQSPQQLRQSLATIEQTLNQLEQRAAQQQQGQSQGGQPSREALIAEARRRGLIR